MCVCAYSIVFCVGEEMGRDDVMELEQAEQLSLAKAAFDVNLLERAFYPLPLPVHFFLPLIPHSLSLSDR